MRTATRALGEAVHADKTSGMFSAAALAGRMMPRRDGISCWIHAVGRAGRWWIPTDRRWNVCVRPRITHYIDLLPIGRTSKDCQAVWSDRQSPAYADQLSGMGHSNTYINNAAHTSLSVVTINQSRPSRYHCIKPQHYCPAYQYSCSNCCPGSKIQTHHS